MVKSVTRQVVQGGCMIMTGTRWRRRVISLWMYAGRCHWISRKAAFHVVCVYSTQFWKKFKFNILYEKIVYKSFYISVFPIPFLFFVAYLCFSIPFVIVYFCFSIPCILFLLSSEYLVSEHLVASSYPSSCHHVYIWYVFIWSDNLTPCLVVLFILTSLGYMVSYMANICVVLMRWI